MNPIPSPLMLAGYNSTDHVCSASKLPASVALPNIPNKKHNMNKQGDSQGDGR